MRLAALAALLLAPLPSPACPFCASQGQTLLGEVNQADMVLYGEMKNARQDPQEFAKGTTDLHVEEAVKGAERLAGKSVVTLPRYIPPEPGGSKYLVFCEIIDGQVDPYRGIQVKPGGAMVGYLKGAARLAEAPVRDRLTYFFDYLNHRDPNIANDAYTEYGNASYQEYRPVAESRDPAVLAGWVTDPETPAVRLGLYGSMLGHCGGPEHAALLRRLLDDPGRRFTNGLDGMLAGYVLLDPRAGWDYLTGKYLNDAGKPFLSRLAALRAARFFWQDRPDVVGHDKVIEAVAAAAGQPEVADIAIDDLRQWGQWHLAGRLLPLYDAESHADPIVRRAVLRYALDCDPATPGVAEFLAKVRAADPERVRDIEELLRLERQARQDAGTKP